MNGNVEGTQTLTPGAQANYAEHAGSPASEEIAKRMSSGGSWFYWLAALSLINSIILYSGGEWSFLFGLGLTQLVDAIVLGAGEQLRTAGVITGLAVNVMVAALFVVFGLHATKGRVWAFGVGGLLYLGDAALVLLFQDFLSLAFHAWVLFSLWRGYQAARQL